MYVHFCLFSFFFSFCEINLVFSLQQFSHVVGQVQLVTGSNGQQQIVIIPMTQQGAALQPAGVTMPAGELS